MVVESLGVEVVRGVDDDGSSGIKPIVTVSVCKPCVKAWSMARIGNKNSDGCVFHFKLESIAGTRLIQSRKDSVECCDKIVQMQMVLENHMADMA